MDEKKPAQTPILGRISPITKEGFDHVSECLRERRPIVMISVGLDGTRTESMLWHPDDPVALELPSGYQGPRTAKYYFDRIGGFPHRLFVRIHRNIYGRDRKDWWRYLD